MRLELIHLGDNFEKNCATVTFDEYNYPNRISYNYDDLQIKYTGGLIVLLFDKDDDQECSNAERTCEYPLG